jgi:hypothetical protein
VLRVELGHEHEAIAAAHSRCRGGAHACPGRPVRAGNAPADEQRAVAAARCRRSLTKTSTDRECGCPRGGDGQTRSRR